MSFFNTNNNAVAPSTSTSGEKDIEVPEPPPDSISSLAFGGDRDYLAVGSWDNNVRLYEIGPTGMAAGKAMYTHQGPVLDVCWSKDGTKVFSGGADNAGRMFDISTGTAQQVAQHDAPIKCVRWFDAPNMPSGILATGSWDKTIKYWDLRTSNPVGVVNLPERCYALDVQYPLLVVGTAERHIQIINLGQPTQVFKQIISPLKWQTRVISCFTQSTMGGYAVGSVEGRVAIQYVDDKQPNGQQSDHFSFKCHRKDSAATVKDQALVYAVNAISFHPIHGTFSTGGSDGTIHLWDKDARTRLKSFDPAPGPITATAFNGKGNIFAYAVSYDWSKGHSGMTPGHPNKIMLHPCKDDEVKKRTKK